MARIDDSHQPYKRKTTEGPGPKRRPKIFQAKDYECARRKPTSTHYVQVCRYIGDGPARKPKIVKTKKSTKRKYNKIYRKWAKTHRTATAKRTPGYRCRKQAKTKCK